MALALILASCDVLNQSPKQSLPAGTVLTTAEGARSTLYGAYDALQAAIVYDYRFAELAGDYAQHSGSYPSWGNIDAHSMLSSNAEARDTWINFYYLINISNNLITQVPNIDDPAFATGEKDQIVAEAKVLRALAYHKLVTWFGGVPLITKPTTSIQDEVTEPRSSVADVYTQIIKDLTEAEATLGANGAPAASTVTGWTAKALLARVYLYNGQYDQALAYANDVIDNGPFTLAEDYIKLFGQSATDPQGNAESIFELQYTVEDNNNMGFWALPNGYGGRQEYAPTSDFVNAFSANDTRFDANIRVVGGDTILGKYFRAQGNDNMIIVRLAEMYLIKAEALAEINYTANKQEALDALDVIRNRAGLNDTDPTSINSQQDLIDAVLAERGRELALEGHRWHDLVRLGKAEAMFGINANMTLWPIPQREMDSNPNLDQNPGY